MAGRRGQRWVTASEQLEIRRRVASGEAIGSIAAGLGRTKRTIFRVIARSGSIPPRATARSALRLSVAEREEISRGLRAGESFRRIAIGLGRRTSTVSREVGANGGRRRYRAYVAETRAAARARRPRPAKLARNRRLRRIVEGLLELRWSPQQIAWQVRQDHPHEPEMWVSHETIYQSLFVQGRGALRAELTRCLRTGRARRRPAARSRSFGDIADMVLVSARPAEVEDRAVPGHWEGDLIIGKANRSAIGTLVERQTRFVMLVALPNGRTAESVRAALAERILTLPAELRRSLTWDRGKEMAEHVRFTVETGVQVYFCDPHSPWQRGSNENTNGLVRQYFPKGTDLSVHSQAHLDAVARELNGRPRQTLGWMKPSEALAIPAAIFARGLLQQVDAAVWLQSGSPLAAAGKLSATSVPNAALSPRTSHPTPIRPGRSESRATSAEHRHRSAGRTSCPIPEADDRPIHPGACGHYDHDQFPVR